MGKLIYRVPNARVFFELWVHAVGFYFAYTCSAPFALTRVSLF